MEHSPLDCLKRLMQNAGIPSYRALATQAQVSRWQIQQLRTGNIRQMRVEILAQLAAALQISLATLLIEFSLIAEDLEKDASQLVALQQAYQHLQADLTAQVEAARSQLQTEALQTLESWLVQWPTIAKRAQTRADLPAAKILPFVRPVEQLMAEWGVEAIAPVDAHVAYDPQRHQLVAGIAQAGEMVQVTHSGAQHQGRLLHRAKVKPI
ncbi:MAG: helix-turn-helix transcriptional regulator [Phormidesmis sp. RL_2_1]|nr:helix-turn-helix transcriptional regulator [Phormidesmis sp. RL_2_1]